MEQRNEERRCKMGKSQLTQCARDQLICTKYPMLASELDESDRGWWFSSGACGPVPVPVPVPGLPFFHGERGARSPLELELTG